MGRPQKHDVDYFPFFAKRGKTLNILQSKYGLEGIGFFTNLLRFLALTPDHYYCMQEEHDRLNFFAEIGIQDEEKGLAMIELMVKTDWLLCPVCQSKSRTRIRTDTTLTNFPLFCPKCKQETLVNVKQLNTSIIKEPDAKAQSQ